MRRRTESADETRQRIVLATFALHGEKGIAATSVRDIAERADVAVGSVYHHFPTYDAVVDACGAYTLGLTQPPDASIFEGIDDAGARLEAMVDSLYSFYARFPGFERVRVDRAAFAGVDKFMLAEEDTRRQLLVRAVGAHRVDKQRLALAFALLDAVVYRSLRAEGLSQAAAVESTAQLLRAWLLGAAPPGPRRAGR
jgi:AcrR family transcriptional regulator